MARRILHLVLFVVGLLGTAWFVRSLDELPITDFARSKMQFGVSIASEYDTIFLGSSRSEFGLFPAAFDAEATRLKVPSRSLNLALSGFRPFEYYVIADLLCRKLPPAKRTIFIELHAHTQSGIDQNFLTPRRVETHPPSIFWARIGEAFASTATTPTLAENLYAITAQTTAHLLCIGEGPRIFDDLIIPVNMTNHRPRKIDANKGWRDVWQVAPQFPALLEANAKWSDPQKCAKAVKTKSNALFPSWFHGGLPVEFLLELTAKLKASGFDVYFVILPELTQSFPGRDGVAEIAKQVPVIDLDQPLKYPEMFDSDLFFDNAHRTAAGATQSAVKLAQEYAALRKR